MVIDLGDLNIPLKEKMKKWEQHFYSNKDFIYRLADQLELEYKIHAAA